MFVATFDGRLARDAEFRYTPGGKPVLNFVVMTDFIFPGKDESATLGIKCTFWGDKEKLVDYLSKGRQVLVVGDCRFSIWHDNGRMGIEAECNVYRLSFGAAPKGAE